MKQLVCEMCGSTELIKQEGMFVCQSCGIKYSVEDAKKMMIEGTVEVVGTIKVDSSDKLGKLYQIARRAKEEDNSENAAKYYDLILQDDPMSWEAAFYTVYYSSMQTNLANIQSAATRVHNCTITVLKLIKEHVTDTDEQEKAVAEVHSRVIVICDMLFQSARNHFQEFKQVAGASNEFTARASAVVDTLYNLGNQIEILFSEHVGLINLAVYTWKHAVPLHRVYMLQTRNIGMQKATIKAYEAKIKKYDPNYRTSGCYVATCVYGSYDCPQVWTLRRYRDNQLAKTPFGRAFIRTYYTISPTLVKWFGDTRLFNTIWKACLDRIISNLQTNGIEDTPYKDKI